MNDKTAKIGAMRQWAIGILQRDLNSWIAQRDSSKGKNEPRRSPRLGTDSTEGNADLNRKLSEWLKICHEIGAVPPEELLAVVDRQLDVGGRIRNAPRLKAQQMLAAIVLAHVPAISDKKLAKFLRVSRTIVSRWRKESSFQALTAKFELDGVLIKEVSRWQQKPSR